MNSTNTEQSPKRAVAPARRRWRAQAGWIALLLAATGGVALATEGERYPGAGDGAVEASVEAWRTSIPGFHAETCTGDVNRSGSESTRDPDASTPNVPRWTELGTTRDDGAKEFESHGGGDTDDAGTDSYLHVKLVGIRANLFCSVILEAEDGASSEWKIRYRGTETVTYDNGSVKQGDLLEITNPWSIGWTRRVVDFDATNGEFDEEKAIEQKFGVRCDLVDGSSVGDGAEFHRVVPLTESSTTSTPLRLKAGAKSGDPVGVEGGVEVGFDRSSTRTYDTKFHEMTSSSERLAGVAKVTGKAPCPDSQAWTIATEFNGDFSIVDHEDFTGDKGSRQEFLLTVINEISVVRVSGCHDCGTPPPPRDPTSPVTPPDPTLQDPTLPAPAAPGVAVRPVTSRDEPIGPGPVITPRAGEEPGWEPESGMPRQPLNRAGPALDPDAALPASPPSGPLPVLPMGPTGSPPASPVTPPVVTVPGSAGCDAPGATDATPPR